MGLLISTDHKRGCIPLDLLGNLQIHVSHSVLANMPGDLNVGQQAIQLVQECMQGVHVPFPHKEAIIYETLVNLRPVCSSLLGRGLQSLSYIDISIRGGHIGACDCAKNLLIELALVLAVAMLHDKGQQVKHHASNMGRHCMGTSLNCSIIVYAGVHVLNVKRHQISISRHHTALQELDQSGGVWQDLLKLAVADLVQHIS